MKKTVLISLLILIIFSGCYLVYVLADLPNPFGYIGWQSVSIEKMGTFKVPRNWIFTHKKNTVFFTDKQMTENEYKIYLAGVNLKNEYDPADYELVDIVENKDDVNNYYTITQFYQHKDTEEIDGKWLYFYSGHDFFNGVQYLESIKGRIFSNSSSFGINRYNINGSIEEKYHLEFHNRDDNSIDLLSWDNLVNEKTMIKIAKSYKYW